jgi:hypothetical protein
MPHIMLFLSAIAVGSFWYGPLAAQAIAHPPPGSPLRAQLLDTVRPVFVGETNGPIEFVVRNLNIWGDWAFGDVKLQRPGGRTIDWRKTKYAEDFKFGIFDPGGSYFLLKRIDLSWAVVEYIVGPTDVAWDAWRTAHHLPRALFERPNTD